MSLQIGDKLFEYYPEGEEILERCAYFGEDFGTVNEFHKYVQGYIYASKTIFYEFMNCEEYRTDIMDTLVFPLCYVYRHIIELYIKYYYFKFSGADKEAKRNFLKKVSHNLVHAWEETKPCVEKRLQKIGNPIDCAVITELICELDSFDPDSFHMRYPIDKSLKPTNPDIKRLNVIHLHEKMTEWFQLLENLEEAITPVILDNNYSIDTAEMIARVYSEAHDSIMKIPDKLKLIAEEQNIKNPSMSGLVSVHDIARYTPRIAEKELAAEVQKMPNDHAALLALLVHTGERLASQSCVLAVDAEEQKKDLFCLFESVLKDCSHFIDFYGKYSNEKMCYSLLEKSARIPLNWLQRIIPIVERAVM